jgi:hypothetical protein
MAGKAVPVTGKPEGSREHSGQVDAEGGRDFVYAQDGRRDRIICGTNLDRKSERDEVWVDRLDDVAGDCEIVHRRR